MKDGTDLWKVVINENDFAMTDGQFQLLTLYHNLLKEWNAKINLVSRKDEGNIWQNHIIHSISLLWELELPPAVAIADIGSGGGLPGVPLAIMLPDAEIVMIESIKKKCVAVNDILARLQIRNALMVNGRAEDIVKSSVYRNRFDLVVARAVGTLKELAIWSLKLARSTHRLSMRTKSNMSNDEGPIPLPVLVAFKGGNIEQEVAALNGVAGIGKIRSHDIQFRGIEKTGLVDKKLVLAELSPTSHETTEI